MDEAWWSSCPTLRDVTASAVFRPLDVDGGWRPKLFAGLSLRSGLFWVGWAPQLRAMPNRHLIGGASAEAVTSQVHLLGFTFRTLTATRKLNQPRAECVSKAQYVSATG